VQWRHRFIDDALARSLAGPLDQVVILGAGYDTRAYRFADRLRGRRVYELDFPSTSRRKRRIVEEHGGELPLQTVERIEIDFEHEHLDDVLLAAGFAPGKATFFVWEGVAMYLSRAAVKDTLARIRALCGAGSVLAMDYWFLIDAPDVVSTAYRVSPNLLHLVGEPITFSLHPEDARPFMQTLGYEIADLGGGDELRRRYVRDGRHVYPGNYVLEAHVVQPPSSSG
jgi:methyltransferase (TIGR00027 family)